MCRDEKTAEYGSFVRGDIRDVQTVSKNKNRLAEMVQTLAAQLNFETARKIKMLLFQFKTIFAKGFDRPMVLCINRKRRKCRETCGKGAPV